MGRFGFPVVHLQVFLGLATDFWICEDLNF